MEELRLIENQLLPVYQNDKQEQLVNARELHEFMEVSSKFADWIKNRIEKYGFLENVDYITISKNLENGGRTIEYILTMNTAKEIAMVENNEKGRQARRYFIEIENRYKTDLSQLPPELQMLNQMVVALNTQALKVNQIETKIDSIQSNLLTEHKDDWREYVNKVLRKVGMKLGNYQTPRNDSYDELEKRASCNLKTRLHNMKARAIDNNKSLSFIQKLNYLDILEDEPRLREIYLGIIREFAIKYEVM